MKLISADFIGIGASIACAIHCAILPLFLSGLCIFGVNIIHNFWFESGMIALAFLLGILSLSVMDSCAIIAVPYLFCCLQGACYFSLPSNIGTMMS